MQAYGVLGYSMAMALALASVSVGLAYFRAGRDKTKSVMFTLSAFLFAILFGYLVIVSIEPPWLNRAVMQPAMRTVALAAAVCGWAYLLLVLRKEARLNSPRKRGQTTETT